MPTLASRPSARAAMADWRRFGNRSYRPFRLLAVAQGFIGALSGPAIVLPLLLAMGAHPALATLLAVLPVIGTTAQRFVPNALRRTDGNLRGLVALAALVGEPRGLLMALVVGLVAMDILPAGVGIGLIALAMGALGAIAAVGAGLLGSWYQIILPDSERRVIAPRLAGITLGIGSLVLLPLALTIDGAVASMGLWAYAVPLAAGGTAGIVAAVAVRRLPSPGRVRIPAGQAWRHVDDGRLRGLARVLALASLAGGLSPFLAIYAIAVLGTGPGFAIGISAVSSASLVVSALVVSSQLVRGSSSRLLRASQVLRGFALLLGLAAHPANPYAPLVLLVVTVLLAAGDTAGQLSSNERLFRLATGPSVIAFQSHFVVHNVASYAGGLVAASGVMLLGGYPAFAILFVSAGAVRFAAAWATQTSPRGISSDTTTLRVGPGSDAGEAT